MSNPQQIVSRQTSIINQVVNYNLPLINPLTQLLQLYQQMINSNVSIDNASSMIPLKQPPQQIF